MKIVIWTSVVFFVFVTLILFELVINTPCTLTKACSGLKYKVVEPSGKTSYHTIPDNLEFEKPSPYMLKSKSIGDQIDLVKKSVNIFKLNNIQFWITCGTLLGAIRHNGLIPWDDDIDYQVPVTEEKKLLNLESSGKFKEVGMKLIEAGGGYKLCRDNWSRWPFIDLIMVAPREDRMDLAWPRNKNGSLSFSKASDFSQECYLKQDIYPLIEVPFNDIKIPAPNKSVKLIHQMYGSNALTTVPKNKHDNFLWNHRSMMALKRLGFVRTSQT